VKFTLDELRPLSLFEGLSDEQLAWFRAHGEKLSIEPGDRMLERGQPADHMFVVVSGSVDGYVWDVVSEVEPELAGATKIVRRSEWLGFPPIAAPSRLAGSPVFDAIAKALIGMNEDPIGQDALNMLRLNGFETTGPELYDAIAAKYDKIRSAG